MKYHNEHELGIRILAHLEEELEDVCKYNDLYESLIQHDMENEAIVIERIASDEYRHAEKIWRMLGKFDVNIPDKVKALWDRVEEIFIK